MPFANQPSLKISGWSRSCSSSFSFLSMTSSLNRALGWVGQVSVGGHGSECSQLNQTGHDCRNSDHGYRLGPVGVQLDRPERRVHRSPLGSDPIDLRRRCGHHDLLQGVRLSRLLPQLLGRVHPRRQVQRRSDQERHQRWSQVQWLQSGAGYIQESGQFWWFTCSVAATVTVWLSGWRWLRPTRVQRHPDCQAPQGSRAQGQGLCQEGLCQRACKVEPDGRSQFRVRPRQRPATHTLPQARGVAQVGVHRVGRRPDSGLMSDLDFIIVLMMISSFSRPPMTTRGSPTSSTLSSNLPDHSSPRTSWWWGWTFWRRSWVIFRPTWARSCKMMPWPLTKTKHGFNFKVLKIRKQNKWKAWTDAVEVAWVICLMITTLSIAINKRFRSTFTCV